MANAATAKDPAFISDVSEVWKPGANVFKVATTYLTALNKARTLTQAQTEHIQSAIGNLDRLAQYSFNALVLTSNAGVETVAEVFVRINGQGVKLNQADFILTLMSVFWEDGRRALEEFSRSAAGHPDAVLEVVQRRPVLLSPVTLPLARESMEHVRPGPAPEERHRLAGRR